MSKYDAVVLLGFGGPERSEEIRPFLDRVLQGRPIPQARYEAVVEHYVRIGGRSPFNELTQQQAAALEAELKKRGTALPVFVAYKNAAPFFGDTERRLREGAYGKPLAIILAVHQSPASWDKYKDFPGAAYAPPFYEHPLFVRANADRVRGALRQLG